MNPPPAPALPTLLTRRSLLRRCGLGLGAIGLAGLLRDEGLLAAEPTDPLAPRPPHFPGRAKRIVWLFMNGGPSHMDTWDHKPALGKYHGQELKGFDKHTGFFANQVGGIARSPFAFTPRGQSGKMVSEIFPHLGEHVDKMAFIHTLHTESNNHSPALFALNSGHPRMGFPCLGSWVTYGLGSESRDLPAFVVMSDPKDRGLPKGAAANWSAGFLPGAFQGTYLRPRGEPIENLTRPAALDAARQRAQLDLMARLNRADLAGREHDTDLAARIESFELAYRMQSAAPEALAVEREPEHIRKLYGLDDERCAHIARQCLIARRLIERGTRMVQIYSGGMENQRSWDGHMDLEGNHRQFAGETDRPIAGLLTDLAQRGLLEDTLVIWGGEFGRLPIAQTGPKPGRDHNPHCGTIWMAGGGVKGGVAHGQSDELGFKPAADPVHINDLHATILHLLGLDHEKLTYRYNGRRFRLTDVGGHVIRPILA
jgi:hypothetical protein